MKIIYKLIGLLSLICFGGHISAQISRVTPVSTIDIEANIKNMKKMYLSQFTDNVRYIPLQTSFDHLIEEIRNLDISDKYILASTMTACYLGADGIQQPASINKFKNKVFDLDPMDDTLFYLNDLYEFVPQYVFKLGKYAEKKSERAKGPEGLGYSNSLHVLNVLQTENFLFFDCRFSRLFPAKRLTTNDLGPMPPTANVDIFTWYNMTNTLGIYNKKTSSLVFSEQTSTDNYYFTTGLYNDIDGGPRFLPSRMVNDSTMLMILYFPHLREHVASDDFKNSKPTYPEKKRRLEALTDSLKRTEIDVPVLMLVNFNN
jgi:hypothetical protein